MSPINRSLPKIAFVVLIIFGFSLASLAQPNPSGPGPLPLPAPGPTSVGPGMMPSAQLPPMMKGTLSPDEFKQFMTFQQQINDDPALKTISTKIAQLTKEIQLLRAEANATREKLTAANPEIQKIADKMKAAMSAGTGKGPMPMPMPTPPKNN